MRLPYASPEGHGARGDHSLGESSSPAEALDLHPAEQSQARAEIRLLQARLERASEHFQAFGDIWNAYLARRPHHVRLSDEPDGSISGRLQRDEDMPVELSVLLGEYLYELRAALDNCLYAVAVITSGQNPPPNAERLEWPIRASRREWTNQVGRYRALPDVVVEALEAIQPYQAEFPTWNSLALLHDLARFDRHRTPKLLALYLVVFRMKYGPDVVTVLHTAEEGVIQPGSALATVRLADGHSLMPEVFDLDVEFDVDVEDVATAYGPAGRHGRPWGSLANRLRATHKAVVEYCNGLLSIATDYAEHGSEV